MKETLLLDAISGIDERYILESAQIRKGFPWKMILVAAACFALVVTIVTIRNHSAQLPSKPTTPPKGEIIWNEGVGGYDLAIPEQAKPGKIYLSEALLTAIEQSDDPSDIFAIQVIEITDATQDDIYEKFIKPLGLEEDYMASGVIFATRAQLEQIHCPSQYGFVFNLATKPSKPKDIPASTDSVISSNLANALLGASDEEIFPVTIFIHDTIDLTAVEKQAMERLNIAPEQLENCNSQEIMDRFNAERIEILGQYYQNLNYGFLQEMGLAQMEYARISTLLPCIHGIRLTKAQIILLSTNKQVQCLCLSDDIAGEDL